MWCRFVVFVGCCGCVRVCRARGALARVLVSAVLRFADHRAEKLAVIDT